MGWGTEMVVRTAFIIGAGSSIAMGGDGFPTGARLIGDIGAALSDPGSGKSRPQDAQLILDTASSMMGHNGVSKFLSTAARIVPLTHTHNSIDQLITNAASEDVTLVAKACIAYFIGKSEAALVALADHRSGVRMRATWLVSFIRELLSRTKTVDEGVQLLDEILFVVFNYDRLVEHLLATFLRDRYEISGPVALQVVRELNIEHPYGMLAPLDLVPADLAYPVGYQGFESDFHFRAKDLVSNLKTFGESFDVAIPERIQALIDGCTNLVFVGFGFGPENLDLILPRQNSGPLKRIYATTTQISERRWRSLERQVLDRLSRADQDQRRLLLKQVYTEGRIDVVQSCGDLIDHFSLEW